jgi:hypothetical protein
MKLFIYFEVLIFTAVFVILRAVTVPIIRFIMSTGAMASFYSKHNIHFWETRKAQEIVLAEMKARLAALNKQEK